MKMLRLSLLAAAGALTLSAAARAQDRPLGLVFNAGGATDYIFRGVSQTRDNPEVFAGADAKLGKIGYAGTWLSNVDFGDSTDLEYDLYGGVRPTVGPVSLDLGFIRYGYDHDHNDWTYWEAKAAGSVPMGPATFGAAFYFSPNATGPGDVRAYYYELNASSQIPRSNFFVSGAVGRQQFEGPGDYTTWNAGVGYQVNTHLGLDFRYWDTDAHSFGKAYKARFVASLKTTF